MKNRYHIIKRNRPDNNMMASGRCKSGKMSYATRASAKKAEKITRHRFGRMRTYQCDDCGNWHNGHMGKHLWADSEVAGA